LAFLIDTGANVTILSKQFIENIEPSLLSQVNPVNVHLVTATGETSSFIGQINVQISLGKKFYQNNVFTVDISNESHRLAFSNYFSIWRNISCLSY
jgi:predicted aspartyl protease